ncbi:Pentatricopeptide repeat-containing protein [Camellia lanceoleosa]|uniref:Pentatricopeptide repeat-containing protein n=1 Tax=Camellia lanceoleosa TaxID=1840588 RepID=A0ACC0FM38_9ERIC|nr:Pentatricopeptide repeat-containing protein [Camellia lanceoleosa]
MISILAKMRKFDTAWALVDEMRGGRTGQSLVTPQTLLILIRRYCAVHEVGKAINTFYAHKLFKFDVGMEEFHNLLSALCRYKNVKDAEHMLFCNENVFPINTKSFNIILNGWCNIICSPREAKRIWREMNERGVAHDVVSYSSIISCYSKSSNLHEKVLSMAQLDNVLKLWSEMSKYGGPDRSSYIALVHGLFLYGKVEEAYKHNEEMKVKKFLPEPKLDEMLQTWKSGKQIANYQVTDSKDNQVDLSQSGNESRAPPGSLIGKEIFHDNLKLEIL